MENVSARNKHVMRVFRVLQFLETTRLGMSVNELHSRLSGEGFAVDPRTVRRDLDGLVASGFPLTSKGTDEQGGDRFCLDSTVRVTEYIVLNTRELLSLYTAKAMLEPLKDTPFFHEIKSLFAKFENFLDDKKKSYLAELSAEFYVNPGPRWGLGLNRDIFDTIHQACAERQWLKVVYYSANSGITRERILGPQAIYMNKGAMYLYAEEKESSRKGELKAFSLARMHSAEMMNEAFEEPSVDIEQHLSGSLGLFAGGDIQEIRVQFSQQVASFIRERQWHPSQRIVNREDGSAELTLELALNPEVLKWILSFGSAARVIGPTELIEAIRWEASKITEIYQNQPKV